jgi:plasmid stabilization system protein ParE
MRIEFSAAALADLASIIEWYDQFGPEVTARIQSDINRALERLSRYPNSGTAISGRSYRRIVTIKYRFKIVHRIEPTRILVSGVFRFQNREV